MTYKVYECHKLDTQKQVFFYEQEFYVLSNFSSFQVRYEGKVHQTSEHLYHWLKFRDPPELDAMTEDEVDRLAYQMNVRQLIFDATSAHDAFKIAQRYKKWRRADWDAVKYDMMRRVLWAKVHQHEYVKQKLLETGDRALVEDSWRDDVWGWGLDQKGQNLLGKCWMEIRDALQNNEDLYPNHPNLKTGA